MEAERKAMTDLTDTYKEVSAQEQNKLLRQQIHYMHEMISGGERLEVELKTAMASLPRNYQYKAQLTDALAVYEHLSDNFLQWLQDNRGAAVFYEKES